MKRQAMNQQATDIMKESIREGGVVHTVNAVNLIPEMVECVTINRSYIRKKAEEALNHQNRNPVKALANILLKLIGLRVVTVKDTINGFEQEVSCGVEDIDLSEAILKLNKTKYGEIAGNIVSELAGVEQRFEKERQGNKEELRRLYKDLDKVTSQYEQLNADSKAQNKAVMERVQYILALKGRETEKDEVLEQLLELLEDFGVDVYWSADDTEFSENTMFSVLKCDNPQSRRMKPCLVSKDTVVLKGTKFVATDVE